jgi:phosphate uptake regulator
MQIRKLVKSGYSSLVVAVPQDWVKKNKLKPGDQLYIEEENNVLVVKTEYKDKQKECKEKVIDIDGKTDRMIMADIMSSYMNNCQQIIIRGTELKKKVKTVKEMLHSQVALELIDESSEKIVAKSFLNIKDVDFKVIIRRIDNIVRSMILDTKECATDHTLAETIIERDKEVNKLNNLVSKILKMSLNDNSILTMLGITEIEVLRYWELNRCLEKIGDRVKNIAPMLPKLSHDNQKKFMAIYAKIEETYLNAMKSFYNASIKISDEIYSNRSEMMQEIKNFIDNTNTPSCSQIGINSFTMMAHINDIARIVRYMD